MFKESISTTECLNNKEIYFSLFIYFKVSCQSFCVALLEAYLHSEEARVW